MKIRTVLATAATALASVGLASAAQAIPPQGFDAEPEPSDEIYSISGSIDLGCTVPASAVKVRIRPLTTRAVPWRTITPSGSGGNLTYTIPGLNRDMNFVLAPLLESIPEGCRYGRWLPSQRQVGPPASGDVRGGVTFTYQTGRVTRLNWETLRPELEEALGGAKVRLNNHGSNDSYVEVRRIRFLIPQLDPLKKPVCVPADVLLNVGFPSSFIPRLPGGLRNRLCVNVGEARLYVNDVETDDGGVSARWWHGVELGLAFESADAELVGSGSNSALDPFVADVQVNDVRLWMRLTLVARPDGRVTYKLATTYITSATPVLVGGCSLLGINICPDLTAHLAKIYRAAEDKVAALVESPQVHDVVDPLLEQLLAQHGVAMADAVTTDSDGFIFIDY